MTSTSANQEEETKEDAEERRDKVRIFSVLLCVLCGQKNIVAATWPHISSLKIPRKISFLIPKSKGLTRRDPDLIPTPFGIAAAFSRDPFGICPGSPRPLYSVPLAHAPLRKPECGDKEPPGLRVH